MSYENINLFLPFQQSLLAFWTIFDKLFTIFINQKVQNNLRNVTLNKTDASKRKIPMNHGTLLPA
jgi:hypothetical protein